MLRRMMATLHCLLLLDAAIVRKDSMQRNCIRTAWQFGRALPAVRRSYSRFGLKSSCARCRFFWHTG